MSSLTERIKITLETSAIRARGLTRTVAQLAGLAAISVAAFNVILAPSMVDGGAIFTQYRQVLPSGTIVSGSGEGALFLSVADLLLFVLGLMIVKLGMSA